jgi:NADH-quinone oxidoreductase subunit A
MPLPGYLGLFVYFAIMAATGVALVAVSHWLQIAVKSDKYDWTRPYECGVRTEGLPSDRYPIHYYLVGIMFVIFDVETVFLVPWAVVGHDFKANDGQFFWLMEMVVFLVILVVGYLYLLQQRVFNWGHEEEDQQ